MKEKIKDKQNRKILFIGINTPNIIFNTNKEAEEKTGGRNFHQKIKAMSCFHWKGEKYFIDYLFDGLDD